MSLCKLHFSLFDLNHFHLFTSLVGTLKSSTKKEEKNKEAEIEFANHLCKMPKPT